MRAAVVLAVLAALGATVARADEATDDARPRPRPVHGALGLGSSTVFGGADRFTGAAAIDVLPGGRFGRWGATGAIRDLGLRPAAGHGIVTVGILREAAAARPRLAMLLHADVGIAWGPMAPVAGGGVRTYLGIYGPFGLAFDVTAHAVVPSVDDAHVEIGLTALGALLR